MYRERTSSFTLPRHPFGSRRSRRNFSSARLSSKCDSTTRPSSKPSNTTRTPAGSSSLPRLGQKTKNDADFSSPSSPSSTDTVSKQHRSSFRRVSNKLFSRMKAATIRGRSSSSDRSATRKSAEIESNCSFNSEKQTRQLMMQRSDYTASMELDNDQLRAYWFGDKTPGAIGLRNHGNTCFINAVLQCLSHTDKLAEYLALNRFKVDLMRRKKKLGLGSRHGTDGEVTEKLANVIKSLWSGQYTPAVSAEFKATVDKFGSQYKGGNQHDAQEFLLWLLDKVHEDLNIAKKRRYEHVKGSSSRADEVLAAESLHNFQRCNESFVHRLFQAQFRSSLTCPHCACQSNTFDPFLCLSLPIPQAARRPVFVTVVFLSQQPREVKLGISMDCDATIGELRETISADTGIGINRCVLAEIDGEGFCRTFSDNQSLNAIDVNDRVHALYAIELPEMRDATEADGEFVSVVLVNVLSSVEDDKKKRRESTRFGSPYVTQLRREMSYADFQKLLLKEMQAMVQSGVLTTDQPTPLFTVEVYTGEREGEILEPELDLPLYAEAVDQALSLSDPDGDGQYGPKHIKLVLRWEQGVKERVIYDDEEHIDDHESVRELEENPQFQPPVTLEQCFREYTSEEVLGTDNAWLCPSCNKKGKGIKKLALWSLPEILIIHLKRFKQCNSNGVASAKLTTLVDFPKTDLDVSAHLAPVPGSRGGGGEEKSRAGAGGPCDAGGKLGSGGGGIFQKMLRRVRAARSRSKSSSSSAASTVANAVSRRRPGPDECSYELYAVCNHHGVEDQGGHYTAFCKNSTDGKWYLFDDVQVTRVEDEADLVTEDAYVLFYHRKPSPLASSSLKLGPAGPAAGAASSGPVPFASSTLPLSSSRSPLSRADVGSRSTLVPQQSSLMSLANVGRGVGGAGGRHWVYNIPGLRPVGGTPSGGGGAASSGEEDSGVVVSRCSSDGLGTTSDSTDMHGGSEGSQNSTTV